MHAADFISTWRSVDLTERAAAQSHFYELCALLGEKTPVEADRKGEWYAFEKGATKTTAAKAGPMSGSAAVSAGNTRARI